MKIPKDTDDLVGPLFKHVHSDNIKKEFQNLIENYGTDALDLLKDQYGDDIKEEILAFLDVDNDGEIIDTVPDLFEEALKALTALISK